VSNLQPISELDYDDAESREGMEVIQLVGLKLGEEEYAIDVLKIQEIIRTVEITSVPRTDAYVLGVMNLRGKVIPVIDLRVRFSLDKMDFDKETRIIVVRFETENIGFVVDEVTEVIRINKSMVEPTPPLVGSVGQEYILGICKYAERLIILLDIDSVVSDDKSIESDLKKTILGQMALPSAEQNYQEVAANVEQEFAEPEASEEGEQAALEPAEEEEHFAEEGSADDDVGASIDDLIALELAKREAETDELNKKKHEEEASAEDTKKKSEPVEEAGDLDDILNDALNQSGSTMESEEGHVEQNELDDLIALELEKREAETEERNKKKKVTETPKAEEPAEEPQPEPAPEAAEEIINETDEDLDLPDELNDLLEDADNTDESETFEEEAIIEEPQADISDEPEAEITEEIEDVIDEPEIEIPEDLEDILDEPEEEAAIEEPEVEIPDEPEAEITEEIEDVIDEPEIEMPEDLEDILDEPEEEAAIEEPETETPEEPEAEITQEIEDAIDEPEIEMPEDLEDILDEPEEKAAIEEPEMESPEEIEDVIDEPEMETPEEPEAVDEVEEIAEEPVEETAEEDPLAALKDMSAESVGDDNDGFDKLKTLSKRIIDGEDVDLGVNLKTEVSELLKLISETKNRMDDIEPSIATSNQHLPNVLEALETVTETTEEATFSLMENADALNNFYQEFVEEVNDLEDLIYRKDVPSIVKKIEQMENSLSEADRMGFNLLHALEFQDITEQKIQKVIASISDIGARLGAIMGFIKLKQEQDPNVADDASQDDIDKLLAEFGLD
jgi:chemotaxis signal transduction protein